MSRTPKLSETAPLIHPDCEIVDSSFGRFTEIGQGTRVQNSTLGDYSYCDRCADIANAEIGKFTNIASFARIGPSDHPLDRASLHHFLYRSGDYWPDAHHDEAFFARRRTRRCLIGHDTWIGHAAIVRPGVRIGHGAVVGAGAIVTGDVAPYTIVAGSPARMVRRRLSEDIAGRLIALAWWDWDHVQLRAALEDFRNLQAEAFLEKYGG